MESRRKQESFSATQGAIIALIAIILLLLLFFAIKNPFQRPEAPAPENTHLSAGELDAALMRTALVKRIPDVNGQLSRLVVQRPSDPPVDFSKASAKNVFQIDDPAEIVPGAVFTATMRLKNEDDVGIGYWVEIIASDPTKTADLAKRLCVTVTLEDGTVYRGSELSVKGEGDQFIDRIPIGSAESFSVTVEVLGPSLDVDYLAKTEDRVKEPLIFDLLVHAALDGGTPTPPTTPPPTTTPPAPTPSNPELTVNVAGIQLYAPLPDPTGDIVDPLGNRYSYAEVSSFPNGGTAVFENGNLALSGITPGDRVAFSIIGENTGDVPLRVRLTIECLEGDELMRGLVVLIDGNRYAGDDAYASGYLTVGVGEQMPSVAVSVELPCEAGNEYRGLTCRIRIRIEAVCLDDGSGEGGVL